MSNELPHLEFGVKDTTFKGKLDVILSNGQELHFDLRSEYKLSLQIEDKILKVVLNDIKDIKVSF